ncbi:steroid receptor RNA activator 1-like [Tigriopus californicus]|nr:steroid receptor RNA activator 1-like [Tigriopus californicus]XP_059094554.1 steroid receptor RNA activator 1-like [Tigriopus californicus]
MASDDEPRPGNWDKAWNDPPLFSYQATSAKASEPTGVKLNKRVGFPGTLAPATPNSSVATPVPLASGLGSALPPPPLKLHDAGAKSEGGLYVPPPPVGGPCLPLRPPASDNAGKSQATSGPTPEVVYDCDSVVALLNQSLARSSLATKKAQDIQKRIDTMADKWKAGALNPPVQTGMGRIADLLEAEDAASAEKIQLSLMVDWPAVCGSWLVGIKHLIISCKEDQAGSPLP